jgi:hypothetical protein
MVLMYYFLLPQYGGHYTCAVYDPSGRVYHCDDAIISTDLANSGGGVPYVLFYVLEVGIGKSQTPVVQLMCIRCTLFRCFCHACRVCVVLQRPILTYTFLLLPLILL